jgi:CheY-like chemotaxis protein
MLRCKLIRISKNMKKKILIVEDDYNTQNAIEDYLEKEGYVIDIAVDGNEGIAKIRRFHPDLILLDLIMPHMDGMSMLEYIKSQDDMKDIPVLILTNLVTPESYERAKKAGKTEYLIKTDWTLHQLKEKIEKVLDG